MAFGPLIVIAAWLSIGASAAAEGSSAILLGSDTFDDFIKQQLEKDRRSLIMFHVGWCKVCQKTMPEFVSAASTVQSKDIAVDFAHVDCTDDKAVCQKFGIKGYPSIKLFGPEDGEPRSYGSIRHADTFVKYAARMTKPPIQAYASRSEFLEAVADEPFSTFVATLPDSAEVPASLLALAKRLMDKHLFVRTSVLKDILPKTIVPPSGTTLMVLSSGKQQWGGKENRTQSSASFYTGPLEEMEQWTDHHRFPGIWQLGEGNFYEFTHSHRRTAVVAFDPSAIVHEEMLRMTARKLSDDFIFGVLDGVALADELSDFNFRVQDLPRVLVTEDDFGTWMEDVEALRASSLEADLRSLLAGAPVLRQTRDVTSRIRFYGREAFRTGVTMYNFGSQGYWQAALVGLSMVLTLVVVFLAGVCCLATLKNLFSDPEPEYYEAYRNSKRE